MRFSWLEKAMKRGCEVPVMNTEWVRDSSSVEPRVRTDSVFATSSDCLCEQEKKFVLKPFEELIICLTSLDSEARDHVEVGRSELKIATRTGGRD